MRFRVSCAFPSTSAHVCLLLLLLLSTPFLFAIHVSQHHNTLDMTNEAESQSESDTIDASASALASASGGCTGSCTKVSSPCSGWRINGLCTGTLTSCCVPPGKCTFGGRSLNCMLFTKCNQTPGMHAVKGLCAGPSSIQCCVPNDACQVVNKGGTCMATASCKTLGGTSTPGYCPGGRDNQCCTDVLPSPPTPAPTLPPPQPTATPDPCDGLVIPTTTFAQYIQLVACYEKTTKATPRQVLSDIRQIYYGNEAWSKSTSFIWNSVIPCKLPVVDPRISTRTLYDALKNSQDTTRKTDMGHVFTGWEALLCRSAGCLLTTMPNDEFATWGGDLGSAAAQMAHDDVFGSGVRPMIKYVGGPTGLAGEADLRGDIDAYLVAKTINGGIVSGTTFTNKAALLPAISAKVKQFAQLWYINLTKTRIVIPIPDPRITMGALKLGKYSDQVTQAFLDWVESRLAFP